MSDEITEVEMMLYLRRRADYLAKRVAEVEAKGKTASWDKGEMLALRMAITRLKVYHREHPEPDRYDEPEGGPA